MDGCRREVLEETGVIVHDLSIVGLYFGSVDALLRITFAAIATSVGSSWAAGETEAPVLSRGMQRYGAEIIEGKWFRRDLLPHPMPALARRMIVAAIDGTIELVTITDDSELI
jgi:NADH pyrophosphatase NudC (nudix superfamily)